MKCLCGSELKTKKEPCIFNDDGDCTGCALCTNGVISICYCDDEDCIAKEIFDKEYDLDDE